MAFWIACNMKAIIEQIDKQPKIIKLFILIMQEIYCKYILKNLG
jgi:hypothetical protein